MIQSSFFRVSRRSQAMVSAVALSFAVQGADRVGLSNAEPPASMDEVVSEVVAKNPELTFYEAELDAARAERRTAGTFANPELSGTLGEKRVSVGPVTTDGLAWSASVRQTFEWPGRIPLRKAIANQQIKLAELGLEQFKAALAARARILAFNLFSAQERASAAGEVAERFRSLRETLVQRDPAGLTPVLETRIIEATELTLQRKATDAMLAEQSAQLELNQLRGEPWTNSLTIQPPALKFPPLPLTANLLRAAETNNFELRMREAELDMQGLKYSLAKNERYPAVSVEPYLSQERAGDRETQFGIGLSIPVPLWNRNEGRIAAEKARQTQAGTALYVAHRTLERQVLEQALAYEARLNVMAHWQTNSVQQFKEAAVLADRHYRLGAVPIATYVELQKQYLEAVDALLSAKAEALNAAQELQRLTGMSLQHTGANEEKQ